MVRLEKHTRVVVAGLGNVLLTDDGVGVHAVRRLKDNTPKDIIVSEVGTAVLGALDLLEKADVVIAIDAVKADGPPGSIYCLDVDDASVQESISLHDHGIATALQHLPAKSRPQVVILGVEPEVVACGMTLSPKIEAALPQVVEIAAAMAEQALNDKGAPCSSIPGADIAVLKQWEFDHEEI